MKVKMTDCLFGASSIRGDADGSIEQETWLEKESSYSLQTQIQVQLKNMCRSDLSKNKRKGSFTK